ncbi:MAG: hypothetical protein L6R41_006054 [Letrouitia leprolyta]|nr:MAG: hypothetical protein L6R41_006054 [Letrouitia leprolyta]
MRRWFASSESHLVRFSNHNYEILPADQKVEEEFHDAITQRRYYPVQIGDTIIEKYQILGKLGFGVDISAWNILLGIEDKSIIQKFVEAEQKYPSPRKVMDGYTVYATREFENPDGDVGQPLLCDFGSAVSGDVEHDEDVQPDVYRAPEVCIKAPWSYAIDIWNVGCLIWDLFEGKHLFYGKDPKEEKYLTRAHLAEMVALMGPPPPDFLKAGKRSAEFFDENGIWRADIPMPKRTSLEESEERLEGSNKETFLDFVRKMIQWRPEDRQTARQLLESDEWLNAERAVLVAVH